MFSKKTPTLLEATVLLYTRYIDYFYIITQKPDSLHPSLKTSEFEKMNQLFMAHLESFVESSDFFPVKFVDVPADVFKLSGKAMRVLTDEYTAAIKEIKEQQESGQLRNFLKKIPSLTNFYNDYLPLIEAEAKTWATLTNQNYLQNFLTQVKKNISMVNMPSQAKLEIINMNQHCFGEVDKELPPQIYSTLLSNINKNLKRIMTLNIPDLLLNNLNHLTKMNLLTEEQKNYFLNLLRNKETLFNVAKHLKSIKLIIPPDLFDENIKKVSIAFIKETTDNIASYNNTYKH